MGFVGSKYLPGAAVVALKSIAKNMNLIDIAEF
jgi:hypothetical protein